MRSLRSVAALWAELFATGFRSPAEEASSERRWAGSLLFSLTLVAAVVLAGGAEDCGAAALASGAAGAGAELGADAPASEGGSTQGRAGCALPDDAAAASPKAKLKAPIGCNRVSMAISQFREEGTLARAVLVP
ncbi:hypothetical protein AA309_09615 [Microvirga vignae]|uniref:Uncharacterized protein n=1 Tax=Microvirga vignae TaxID=1225564 RepID=A0A0H1RKS8_9HYPH|nr:hypothetical protein AA309_09615 [Microvirga vignae]